MDIVKGQQYTLNAKFTRKGSPATFNAAPRWTLYNSVDDIIISGAATQNGNIWEATFTIPTSYIVPSGKEALQLQFHGYDNKNAEFIRDINLTLVDANEGYLITGVVYNAVENKSIKDSVLLPADTANLTIKVYDPVGNQIGSTITQTGAAASSSTSRGYLYNFTIPALGITRNQFNDPYQIMIEYTSGGVTDQEFHPLYILDSRTVGFINTIKLQLDKAGLTEIDASLQWYLPEMIQAIMEGIKYINAFGQTTFWTLKDVPSSIDGLTSLSATISALSSRHIAEGLNAFEFTGLNSQLNYNRADFIGNKISELQSKLDAALANAKKSAIVDAGKGTPPAGETGARLANVAQLHLTVNALNNRIGYYRAGRRFF